MNADDRIAAVADIPEGSTALIRVRSTDETVCEAILVRTDDEPPEEGIACWLNYCRHMTDVRLDTGTGATVRDGEIVCTNHGAFFDMTTGDCTHGPCTGGTLVDVETTIDDGDVYLTDSSYAFVGHGPIDREATDRSTALASSSASQTTADF